MGTIDIGGKGIILPLVFHEEYIKNIRNNRVFIEYKSDGSEYVFRCRPDRDTEIKIVPKDSAPAESAQAGAVQQGTRLAQACYDISPVCGLITSALKEASFVNSRLKLEPESRAQSGASLTQILKEKKSAVIYAAQLDGFKGKDYKKAIKYLGSIEDSVKGSREYRSEDSRAGRSKDSRAVRSEDSCADSREVIKDFNRLHVPFAGVLGSEIELSIRPALSGLFFSILSQFTGMIYYADSEGEVWDHPVPDYYVTGDSREDRILLGIMYWIFYLCQTTARGGSGCLQAGNIPCELRKLIVDLAAVFDCAQTPAAFIEAEEQYSGWLADMIGRIRKDGSEGMDLFNLLREKMDFLCRDLFPVVLNNCLVRAFHFFSAVRTQKEQGTFSSFRDLFSLDFEKILSDDRRLFSDMCLISAGIFAAAEIGREALVTFFSSKEKPKKKAGGDYLLSVDIDGIGSFTLPGNTHCRRRSSAGKDPAACESKGNSGNAVPVPVTRAAVPASVTGEDGQPLEVYMFRAGSCFPGKEIPEILYEVMFEPQQLRLARSLESLLVRYDISDTEPEKEIALKKKWLRDWESIAAGTVKEEPAQYLIRDEKALFEEIRGLSEDEQNKSLLYRLILELEAFDPYCAIGSRSDKDYKKLKIRTDYIRDRLLRELTAVTGEEADQMKKLYEKYRAVMGGTHRSRKPRIKALPEGALPAGPRPAQQDEEDPAKSQLPSAGSAYGDMPQISMMTIMLAAADGDLDDRFARLLVYGRYILRDRVQDEAGYRILRNRVSALRYEFENLLEKIRGEKNSLDVNTIRLTEVFLKYLRRLDIEMQKKGG